MPTHDRIATIAKHLAHLSRHDETDIADLDQLHKELQSIDNARLNGNFTSPSNPSLTPAAGQVHLNRLLHQTWTQLTDLRIKYEPIAESLQPTFKTLCSLVNDLQAVADQAIVGNDARIDELLDRIDELDRIRQEGVFVPKGSDRKDAEDARGQQALQWLMERAYTLVHEVICAAAGKTK